MKKIFLFIMAVLVSTTLLAQWELTSFVDNDDVFKRNTYTMNDNSILGLFNNDNAIRMIITSDEIWESNKCIVIIEFKLPGNIKKQYSCLGTVSESGNSIFFPYSIWSSDYIYHFKNAILCTIYVSNSNNEQFYYFNMVGSANAYEYIK